MLPNNVRIAYDHDLGTILLDSHKLKMPYNVKESDWYSTNLGKVIVVMSQSIV